MASDDVELVEDPLVFVLRFVIGRGKPEAYLPILRDPVGVEPAGEPSGSVPGPASQPTTSPNPKHPEVPGIILRSRYRPGTGLARRSGGPPADPNIDFFRHGREAHEPHEPDLEYPGDPLPQLVHGGIESGDVSEGVGHPFKGPLAGEDQLRRGTSRSGSQGGDQQVDVGILNIPDPVHERYFGPQVIQVETPNCVAVHEEANGPALFLGLRKVLGYDGGEGEKKKEKGRAEYAARMEHLDSLSGWVDVDWPDSFLG